MNDPIAVIIPCKSIETGKSRLQGILNPNERRMLNMTLLVHTIQTVLDCRGVYPVILSADAQVHQVARGFGCAIVVERGSQGISLAMKHARNSLGISKPMIYLPSDLPFLTSEELQEIISQQKGLDGSICADRHQDGTNFLFIPPNMQFEFHFGAGSFLRHKNEFERQGVRATWLRQGSLEFDLDTPQDFEEYQSLSNAESKF